MHEKKLKGKMRRESKIIARHCIKYTVYGVFKYYIEHLLMHFYMIILSFSDPHRQY